MHIVCRIIKLRPIFKRWKWHFLHIPSLWADLLMLCIDSAHTTMTQPAANASMDRKELYASDRKAIYFQLSALVKDGNLPRGAIKNCAKAMPVNARSVAQAWRDVSTKVEAYQAIKWLRSMAPMTSVLSGFITTFTFSRKAYTYTHTHLHAHTHAVIPRRLLKCNRLDRIKRTLVPRSTIPTCV